jgi:hypothetical protein
MRRAFTAMALAGMLAFLSGAADGQDAPCSRLAAQLRSLNGGEQPDPGRLAQYRDAIERQRFELSRTGDYFRSVGCDVDPASSGQCRALEGNIRRMQRNLTNLEAQLDRVSANAGRQRESERERIVAMLDDLGCSGEGRPSGSPRSAGLFEQLFGPDEAEPGFDQPPSAGDIPASQDPQAGEEVVGSSLRTICVRKCDGFFFPISFSTSSAAFPSDEQACRAQCPSAEVELYAYDTYSQQPDDAISASTGEPLRSLPNAFKFRTQFVQSCTCNASGQSTAQSVAPAAPALKRLEEPNRETPPAKADAPPAPAAAPDPGKTIETTTASGQRKRVRVVGPSFIPAE